MAVFHSVASFSDSNLSSKNRCYVSIVIRFLLLPSSVLQMQKPPSIGITLTMYLKSGSLAMSKFDGPSIR